MTSNNKIETCCSIIVAALYYLCSHNLLSIPILNNYV